MPAAVKSAAQTLLATRTATMAVNYTESGTPWPGAALWELDNLHGLSLYFPLTDEWKRAFYGPDALPRFANATAWDEFIQAWYADEEAPDPPDEPCDECHPTPPMHIALTIDAPDEAISVGNEPIWLPISLHGVASSDDLRGVQMGVRVTDTTILVAASDLTPRMGNLFPSESFTYSVPTSEGWDFLLTAPLAPTPAISGTGVVVEFPFYAQTEGCVGLEFSEHLLMNSQPQQLAHHAAAQEICTSDRGSLTGQLYLESRTSGDYDQISITLTGPRATYTTTSNAAGAYSFSDVYQDTYTMTFTHTLFVYREEPNISITFAGTTASQVGLWAGDMDQDGDVDDYDRTLLAAGIIPVNYPTFDINADEETNIGDLLILTANLERANMSSTNPPQGREHGANTSNPLGTLNLTQSEAKQSFHLPAQPNQEVAYTLRASNVTGTINAIGTRLAFPVGTTVSHVELTAAFTGGFLSWQQVDNNLYLIAAPPAGSTLTQETDVAIISLNTPDGNPTITIEANNQVGWNGETFLVTAPLGVELANFSASAEGTTIRLNWETVSELDTLGFNLWRSTSSEAPDMQLNNSLIASQAPGSGQGSAYEFVDEAVEEGTTYYYWLEDMDTNGTLTRHAPVSAAPNIPTALRLEQLRVTKRPVKQWWGVLLMGMLATGVAWWRSNSPDSS